MRFIFNQKGQSLLELVIVIAIALLVVGAITYATISSLRNAQAAQNQNQATKLAQEGIEKVRSARDRDAMITSLTAPNDSIAWSSDELWDNTISHWNCDNPCYFKFSNVANRPLDLVWIGSGGAIPTSAQAEDINLKFKRVIIIADVSESDPSEKQITVLVSWNDFAGDHQSRLATFLRRI